MIINLQRVTYIKNINYIGFLNSVITKVKLSSNWYDILKNSKNIDKTEHY